MLCMPLTRSRRWLLSAAALAILLGTAGGFVWCRYLATYHFAEVDKGVLYRCGNQSMREFANGCRRAGVRTVVMLNSSEELKQDPFAGEPEFCKQNGIRFERIPIDPGHRPTTADVRRFLALVAEERNRPVLVHCAQGLRRTGMLVAAYQMTVLKYDAAKAKDAIVPWGRKPERLNDIHSFIEDYDPVDRTVIGTGIATPETE